MDEPKALIDSKSAQRGAHLAALLHERWGSSRRIERDTGVVRLLPATRFRTGKPRKELGLIDLIDVMGRFYATHDVHPIRPLPIAGSTDTDFCSSGRQLITGHSGLLPPSDDALVFQPVIRNPSLVGKRSLLFPLTATSFTNASVLNRQCTVEDAVRHLDMLLDLLSGLSMHARTVEFALYHEGWARGDVSGVTLFISVNDCEIGDLSLIWPSGDPDALSLDLGIGIERLNLARGASSWSEAVFGQDSLIESFDVLDAVKSFVLAAASEARTARLDAFIRRCLSQVPWQWGALGAERLLRKNYKYWASTGLPQRSFAEVVGQFHSYHEVTVARRMTGEGQ